MSEINREDWKRYISGASIVDCAVRDRNILYIAARPNVDSETASMERDAKNPTHLCAIYLDSPVGQNFQGWEVTGLTTPRLGVALNPSPCAVLISRDLPNKVILMGKDVNPQETIRDGWVTIVNRVKTLFDDAFSVGSQREIYRRTDANLWKKMTELDRGDVFQLGFEDLDAFAENDLYAVGGKGDVWHFDGSKWCQKGFPANVRLATVTCAGDGNVYITGEGGSIWKGRDSTWHQLHEGHSATLWNDVLWFDNRLWLSSDYRLRVWDGEQLKPPVNTCCEEVLLCGHMDARDGVLAIASTDTVMTFDGKDWRVIISPYR